MDTIENNTKGDLVKDSKRNHLKYEDYTTSGIEWLDEIPAHWKEKKLKETVKECINGIWGSDPEDAENVIKCVRVADFDYNRVRINSENLTEREIPENKKTGRVLKNGDLLIEKSGGGDKQLVGRVVLFNLNEKMVCSNFIGRMPVRSSYNPNYLAYLHKCLYQYRVNLKSIKQTTGIQNLDINQYLNERVPIPPLEEQKYIAQFLDKETKKSNRLINKKRELIDLLEEKRASVINDLVTGDTNTSDTKDTELDWFGSIPQGWQTISLRNIVDNFVDYRGATPEKSDTGITLITAKNIENGKLDFSESHEYISEKEYNDWMTRGKPEAGDILITTEAPMGEVAQIQETPVALAQRIILLKSNTDIINKNYLKYFLTSELNQAQLMKNQTGSTAKGIKASKLKGIRVFVPPKEEQNNIVEKIEDESSEIDNLISKVEQGIEYLKEYRRALIAEAVTGQIDVRGEI